jgi:DNA-binding transcriptional MerR regulator
VTPNTLRYYERVGLVGPVERDGAARRVYDESVIAQVVFVTRMRATGMTIRALAEYLELARAGDHTVDRRREILAEHRARLWRQRAAIDACLEVIDRKINGQALLTARTPTGRVT